MKMTEKWRQRMEAMASPPSPKGYEKLMRAAIESPPNPRDPPLPSGTFSVVYADPPWSYDHGSGVNGVVEPHYHTIPVEDICAFGVKLQPHIADNAILFLWATAPKLREALQVMEAWGFKYLTNAVWDKTLPGVGYYFMGQHELLLVGKRGTPPPPFPFDRPRSVLRARRRDHSRKPEEAYAMIERMYPHAKYLELFARNRRLGWTTWGEEVLSEASNSTTDITGSGIIIEESK